MPIVLAGMLVGEASSGRVWAITFNFTSVTDSPDQFLEGFSAAGDLWSSVVDDDVTVNIDIAFSPLEKGVLGRAFSDEQRFEYGEVRDALVRDRRSANDVTAVSNLPPGNSFDILINYTSDNPQGYGSSVPYLDNDEGRNNRSIQMTTANAKALGLISPTESFRDAQIIMNRTVKWDFDRSDGIRSNAHDFVGIAAHEIGHALGFIGGVDILDTYSPYTVDGKELFLSENFFSTVSPLDIFRFSRESAALGQGVIDWTARSAEKYFSIDGGTSAIAPFSTGINYGDGDSNSHWKKDQTIGLMDPDARTGEMLTFQDADMILFDVIGWDINSNFRTNASVELQLFESTLLDKPESLEPLLVSPDAGSSLVAEVNPIGVAPVAMQDQAQAVPERGSWTMFVPVIAVITAGLAVQRR